VLFQGMNPVVQGGAQPIHADAEGLVFRGSQVARSATHHGQSSRAIACGLMVQGDSDLNDPLHANAVSVRGVHGTPNVLENLVSLEELGVVEESDTALKFR